MVDLLDNRVRIRHPEKFFIGGEWAEPAVKRRVDLTSPATEQVFGSVATGSEADVDRAVAGARQAFDHGPWPRMSPAERGATLARLAKACTARADELAHAWSGQMGALFRFAQDTTAMSIGLIDFQAQHAASYLWEEEVPTVYPGSIGLRVREPLGVVAAIAPWNAPFFSLVIKLAPALVAGCTVVLKPSSETPLEAFILAECIEAAGFPSGVVNMLVADRTVADYLVQQPGVDKVSFTGSTFAGKRIGSVCAGRVARCTLELGGKSPAIVLDDVDIDEVTSNLAATLTALSGQVCSNLTRYLVPRSRHDDFVDALAAKLKAIVIGDPYDPMSQMGPLASRRHLNSVQDHVRTGIDEGAKLVTGGGRPAGLDSGFYFEPTLFAQVDNRSRIAQEEIFGPVACVTPYEDLDDAIRLANDTEFGLAGAVFTGDADAAYRIARSVRAGTISQNGLKPDFNIGFGGFKQSGIGREGGAEAVLHYLETKTLVLDAAPRRVA